MANYLLLKVQGASVALFQSNNFGTPELLPTRMDLYKYRGGLAWGYRGSGVMNLGHAIIARHLEDDDVSANEISLLAEKLVVNLLSRLDGEVEHTICTSDIEEALKAG